MEEQLIEERFRLVCGRVGKMKEEKVPEGEFQQYFDAAASYIGLLNRAWDYVGSDAYKDAPLEELRTWNRKLYEPVTACYADSFLNPAFAVKKLGEEYGQLLSFLAAELFGTVPCIFERDLFNLTIRIELFVEIYDLFVYSFQDGKTLPGAEEIRQALYWFMSDYQEISCEEHVAKMLGVRHSVGEKIILSSDLNDLRYLYRYGEYITENEEKLASFLNSLPEEEIRKMADTFTEGYRIGFIATNKDITKKKTAVIEFPLGFERMIRKAAENFEKMGLRAVFYRAPSTALEGRSINKRGFFGAVANKQFEYDHDEDSVLYLDRAYMNRRLEALRSAYEKYREEAAVFGGPAVVDCFGEIPFTPVLKKEACHSSREIQKIQVEFSLAAGQMVNEYIRGEERSFTIIAFPVPAIGEQFEDIFRETVRINTLDYTLYRDLQQTLIDVLNRAEFVDVKGKNGNHTDLRVAMHDLKDPSRETNFENCVADVNIPVGEVFTSPKLKGTDGVLHVKKVFLNGLEYRDLEIHLKDGRTAECGCSNFENPAEGEKYVREHVLYHHDFLPIGEFAIGTNTTAYRMAKKYKIEDRLPILIAEKMGPHFALGDTCYSHAEDVTVFNPDGKEIVAKDNELSLLRKTDPSKAYFNCHTDITIPYEELDSLVAVQKDGTSVPIISEGRFVLKGVEELNRPLDEK